MIKRLVSIFIQGLIAVLPLAVTLFILIWLGTTAERFFSIAVKSVLPEASYITGMGVACGILLVFLIGVLINLWGVPRLIRLAENLIDRIPLVKTIYGAVRDLLGYFSKSDERGARKVVMVCIGDTGIRTLGLLTRDHFDDLPPGLGGEGIVAVYIPFSYQIGGITVFVPRDRVTALDMSLEEAMRFIVTAGAKR
ncbi:DUF502 domain-containing protein [Planctomycetales bacterium ZRK34]|nr:DUF502 domain-containing protein [Planctomycetales bacterium ZRK34]